MKLQSALELQGEVFRKVFNFEELPMAAVGEAPVASTFVDPILMDEEQARRRSLTSARRRIAEDIALGIAEGPGDEEAQLAVLVQNHLLMNSSVIDEIRTLSRREAEIIYIGRQVPLWTQTRNQPLRIGCSISPATVNYSGTLGCFCRESQSDRMGILSNNHVLADVNRVPIGTPVIQQAAGDAGHRARDVVGSLTRFVPIQFGGLPNAVDAAFAELGDHGRGVDTRGIYDSRTPPVQVLTLQPTGVVLAFPGMPVFKTGRTTRHTAGKVRAVNVNNYVVNMGVGLARFDDQITFEMDNNPARAFSAPGDSGSLIVDGQGVPVALLFAGSQSGGAGNLGITGGNPISSVKAQLGVILI